MSLLTLLLLSVGCAPKTILTAELKPQSLKANNLEETISRRDELMLAYSLTSYDEKNKPVNVVNGAWGVEPVKKGQQVLLNKAAPINLKIPRNGKVVASLVLIEVDDYAQAEQLVNKVKQVHNLVSVPAGLLITATEVLTPLKYVTAGLVAAGIGIQLTDRLDNDDLLGQSSVELIDKDIRTSGKRVIKVPARFTGSNLRDAFDYELEYDVQLKTVKLKAGKE